MLLTLLYVLFIVVGLRFFEPYVVGMALFTLAAPWTLYELIKNRFKNILVPLAAWGAWVVFGWSLRRRTGWLTTCSYSSVVKPTPLKAEKAWK